MILRDPSCPHWLFRCRALLNSALVVMLLTMLLSSCSKDASGKPKAEDPRKKMVVPVVVSTAVQRTVPVQLRAIGNVEPYATVAIQSQVSGELMTVHFKEGQFVKKGDLLFTIDPRPFEAKLRQAEANLAKNRAQLQNARKQAERYASVVKKGYVAEEQYDQIMANAAALEATVRADEAAVETARLDLKYCSIRAPIQGYTGELKVDQGNIIKANHSENPMVIINQVNPIYVTFALPEQNLPDVKKYMAQRKLEVEAAVPGAESEPSRGEISFLNNTVDQTTGTFQVKGTFANDRKALWPGQFVNVVLTLTTQPDAVLLPSQAVQVGQGGRYVYVVKADSTVEYRPITVGRSLEAEVIISNGIAAGEKVVTDGQLRLAPGIQVKVVDPSARGSTEGATR